MSLKAIFGAMFFLCAFAFVYPSMVEKPCTLANYGWGLSYHGIPHDCTRYLKCQGLSNITMQCGFGTLWDDDIRACQPSGEVKCGDFICLGVSDGGKVPYDLYCNSYWECQGGIPQAMCCAESQTFNGSSCVTGQCADPCAVDPASPLDDESTVPITVGCPTLVEITYDHLASNFVDDSPERGWLAVNNVHLGKDPVFSGSSSLVVFKQAHVNYGESLEISLVFSVSLATALTNQILLQKGLCSEEPSFIMTVSDGMADALMEVTLILRTEGGEGIRSTLIVPKGHRLRLELDYPTAADTDVWNFRVLHDADGRVISHDSRPKPFAGSIPRNQGSLQIGNGDCSGTNGYTGFTGSIFKTVVRSCGSVR